MMEALNYTGVAMVEYLVNHENGRWIFVEINSRFWGSLPLAVSSGVDFPWYLYDLLVNKKRPAIRPYKQQLYCRNLTEDIEWFRSNIRVGQT